MHQKKFYSFRMEPLPPLISFSGKIHLINSDAELSTAEASMTKASAFGFDTETRPSFKKGESYPPALLQLATNNEAWLIRLRSIKNFDFLKSLFEDGARVKTGVAIKHDLNQLQKLFKFSPQNFIELQDLAKKKNLKNFGLQGMTEEVLQSRLSKRAKITNWDSPALTPQQILYAATDAWVGLVLYNKLSESANLSTLAGD